MESEPVVLMTVMPLPKFCRIVNRSHLLVLSGLRRRRGSVQDDQKPTTGNMQKWNMTPTIFNPHKPM